MKKRIQDQLGSWKAGKFLPLTSRPWSLNSYCLSKLWYRTSCLDLRAGDCDAITSYFKGWLYQDMLLKPQESMLYRQVDLGGLGVHNVKIRAKSMLIHTFIAQAICPKFPTNYYLNSLYRWHVLEHRDLHDPGRPPYFSTEFFSIIRDVKVNTPLNVAWITVRQWYQLLLERGITHTSDDSDSPPALIVSRMEERYPEVDFKNSYRLARLFGLSPEQKSFLFKLLQDLIPTGERLSRIGKVPSAACQYCEDQLDLREHLLTCRYSSDVSTPLLRCVAAYADNISPEDITNLNFKTTEAAELPLLWLVTTCLMYIWEERKAGKKARLENCQAELLARLSLLRNTKWKHYSLHNSTVVLDEMINLHFC